MLEALQVSLAHWNQDEEYGGFGGAHCMVVGGYGAILAGLAQKLNIRFNKAVTVISEEGDDVVVTTADGAARRVCLDCALCCAAPPVLERLLYVMLFLA